MPFATDFLAPLLALRVKNNQRGADKSFSAVQSSKSSGDDERSGRPKTATTGENIAKVHQMVLDDRRIKVREIAEVMNMSKERVCHILNQHLGMRKLSARWVPRLFE